MMPKLFFNKSPLSNPTFSAVWKGVRSNEFQAPAELRFSGIFAVFVYEMDRMGPVIQGVAHHEFVTDISRQIPANSQMMGIKTIIEYTPGYPAGFFRFGSEKGRTDHLTVECPPRLINSVIEIIIVTSDDLSADRIIVEGATLAFGIIKFVLLNHLKFFFRVK